MWDFRFYEASAQILPVLYLAILVEYRLLHAQWEDRGPQFRAIMATAAGWLAVGFAVGEFQALDIVSRGEVPADHEPLAVLTAYLLAAGVLVWPVMDRAYDAQAELGRLRGWLIFLGGGVVWGLVCVVVIVLLLLESPV